MGVFTTSVQELIDDEFDFGLKTDNYAIFDEAYRTPLNRKILDHYRNYEIGYETEEMFHFALNRRMREIMPYYNELYKSTQIEIDPLQTINLSDVAESSTESTSSNESESTNTGGTESRARTVASELPQVMLSPNEDYGTGASDASSNTASTGTGVATATGAEAESGSVNRTMKGSQGHAPMLLMQYRASLLNIDLMVIADLSTLFMGLWNTNDSYTTRGRVFGYGFGYRSV